MNNKKIIGVCGQLASGKDSVTNYLVKRLNNTVDGLYVHDFGLGPLPWIRVGFADAVKRVFMDAFGVSWDFIEEWKRKDEIPPEFDLNVRKGLQHIGDGFRKIQNDVWIRKALRTPNPIVISDCRYLNEAKVIVEHGGFNILLYRPGYENNDPNPSESQIKPYIDFAAKNCKEGPLIDSVSPSGFEYFNYFLINDGSLEDLYKKIDNQLLNYLTKVGIYNESKDFDVS